MHAEWQSTFSMIMYDMKGLMFVVLYLLDESSTHINFFEDTYNHIFIESFTNICIVLLTASLEWIVKHIPRCHEVSSTEQW